MIDAWTRPPVAQEYPYQATDGIQRLLDILKDHDRRIRELKSNLMTPSGVRLTPEGMETSKALTSTGDFTAAGPATMTGPVAVSGPASFTGATAVAGSLDVTGSLSVPPGSISDAALSDPSVPQAVYATATNFAPGAVWSEAVGVDLVVAATATRLLVTADCWVYATNNTTAADDLHARVSVGTVDGQEFLTPLPISGYNTITSGLAALVESLTPGATLRLSARTKTTTGTFAANVANTATLSARLTWLR